MNEKEKKFFKKLIKYFYKLDPKKLDQGKGLMKVGNSEDAGCVGCHIAKIFSVCNAGAGGVHDYVDGRELFEGRVRDSIVREIALEAHVDEPFGTTAWASPPAVVFIRILSRYSD